MTGPALSHNGGVVFPDEEAARKSPERRIFTATIAKTTQKLVKEVQDKQESRQ